MDAPFVEFGPKEPLLDTRFTGNILTSDVPPDLSVWSRKGFPQEEYKTLPNGQSDDPRLFKACPGLAITHCDKARIEEVYVNSMVLPDYNVLASLPRLKEAWIVSENSEQLPQAVFDALSTDPDLRNLIVRGDLSHLDLSVLARLEKLEAIRMSSSHLSPANIKQLSKIKSLRCLEVEDRTLSAACLTLFSELRQISDLRINTDAQVDLSSLKQIPGLSRFEFKGTLGRSTVKQISRLKNLQELIISEIADDDIRYLSTLKKLSSLQILGCRNKFGSGNGFTGETLNALKELKYLSVNSCPITSAGFNSISEIRGLKGLDISRTCPSEESLMLLAKLENLRRLLASSISNIDRLEQLSHKLPNCTIQAQNFSMSY